MKGKSKLILSMILFGSIGLFVRFIPLNSSAIAFLRAAIGCVFLATAAKKKGQRLSIHPAKKQPIKLLITGFLLGLNWVLLFEAYARTSIAQATLLYYTAPILVLLYSFLFRSERLSTVRVFAVLLAFTGLWLTLKDTGTAGLLTGGALYGLGAAACYAGVIVMNPSLQGFTNEELTFYQLLAAAVVLIPYVIVDFPIADGSMTMLGWVLVTILGVVHTGLAYQLYFSGLQEIKAVSAALLSYIDPLAALIFSIVILRESVSLFELLGGFLILSAALVSEFFSKEASVIDHIGQADV